MTLKTRLAALEAERAPIIADVRLASTRDLAGALAEYPVENLRESVATWPEADFAAVVDSIRKYVPDYGAPA
jgi:hypothetical protein